MIDKAKLESEKATLQKDYSELSNKIATFEKSLFSMKNNLHAVHGAIQQVDKFLKDFDDEKKVLLQEGERSGEEQDYKVTYSFDG
jgi:peptidoglycan hydrolase CwlO-like protein